MSKADDGALDFGLHLLAPFPAFGGVMGDRIIVRAGHAEPLALVRILPPCYSIVREALQSGIMVPLNPIHSTDALIEALSPPQPKTTPTIDAKTARKLRPRSGKWPTCRFSLAPAGHCIHCWEMGGPPVPGLPFVLGYPNTEPYAERKPHHYCERHVQECRDMNMELIPAPSGADVDGQRRRHPALTLLRGGKETA